MTAIHTLTLAQIREQLAERKVSAVEATKACLDRIRETEPKIDALLHIDEQGALDRAAALDKDGPDPAKLLWGVPITIKDLVTVKGLPCTCASKILENFVPFFDAHLVTQLKNAGAVILGKNNLDEFAMGSSTEHSAYKQTRNPWDLTRVPGGSSGGSAASVAARQCFASIGSDTGGSIRQPSSCCGTVGLKPTYGRISRYGVVAYASSLDQAGPIARTPEDVALMLQVVAGHDKRDSTSSQEPVPDYLAALRQRDSLKGVRLGMPKEYWGPGMAPEVEAALRKGVAQAEALGAEIVEVSLPLTSHAIAAYYIIAVAEASSNLARFDGVRYGYRAKDAEELIDLYKLSRSRGFGEEVQRRILLGTYVLSAGYYDAYYRKAAQVRRLLRQNFLDALTQCDLMICPTSPGTAFPIGALMNDPLQMFLEDVFTVSLNMAGLPGMVLPVGLDEANNMPVGMQLIGRAFDEGTILSVGKVLHDAIGDLGMPRAVA